MHTLLAVALLICNHLVTVTTTLIQPPAFHADHLPSPPPTPTIVTPLTPSQQPSVPPLRKRTREIRLVALDMDGTLLDSNSRVLPSSAAALREVLAAGVIVMLATGKARPAAVAALTEAGLAGIQALNSNS